MNMKKVIWLSLIISIVALILVMFDYVSRTKTVYVRNGDVLEKYIGLKEANTIYERKIEDNQGRLDTIIAAYQEKVHAFEGAKENFRRKEKEEKEYKLRDEAQRIKNFEVATTEELAKEHEQLLTGVLNQVNAFAEIYAKEKGYDLVIGTTNSGNLMYGKSELDVTEDFIRRLNEYYKKGK